MTEPVISEIQSPFGDCDCFFCGANNASGLHLKFFREQGSDEVFTTYTAEATYCGQKDLFHGGMQMGLLDEAMWWAGYAATGETMAVTMNAKFRFLRPVYVGDTIRITCRMTERQGRDIRLRGRILNPGGKVCTQVSGVYRVLDRERYDQLVSNRP